jgi:hypothetical protein
LFPVPAPRTLKLIGREFHPAFYTPQVQNLLKKLHSHFRKTAVAVVAEDRVVLLAWPIILFDIVSKVTDLKSCARQDRMAFWRAYEEDPCTTALLFQKVTEFTEQWPDVWPKQRLLCTALAAPEFSGRQSEWKELEPYIADLSSEVSNPRKLHPNNYSQELGKINRRRRSILLHWQDCLEARKKVRKSGVRVPPLSLRPSA